MEHLNSKLMLHRPNFFYFRPLVGVLTFHSFISHENIEIPGYLSKGLLLGIPHRGTINQTSNKPCLNTSSLTLALPLGYGTAHHWLSVWILLYPYCNFSFSSSPPEWNLLHADILLETWLNSGGRTRSICIKKHCFSSCKKKLLCLQLDNPSLSLHSFLTIMSRLISASLIYRTWTVSTCDLPNEILVHTCTFHHFETKRPFPHLPVEIWLA